jgi:hypothetical protein
LAKQDKFLWVATMDKMLSCYSAKGKRTAALVLTEDIVDMICISIKRAKVNHVLLVALASGEIRMYKDNKVYYSFNVEKPIMALRFGPYGREQNSLIIIHGKGALTIKILKRLVDTPGTRCAISYP